MKINIDNVITNIDSIEVFWSHTLSKVSLFNVVLDDDGSCINIGISKDNNVAKFESVPLNKEYSVKVSALVGSRWFVSDPWIIKI